MLRKYLFTAFLALISFLTPVTISANSLDQLAIISEQLNGKCPIDTGEGKILTSTSFDKDSKTLVYKISWDRESVELENLEENRLEELKNSIKKGLTTESAYPLLQILSKEGCELKYVYTFKDGQVFDVIFTPADMNIIQTSILKNRAINEILQN